MKRFISMLLVLALMLGVVPFAVSAQSKSALFASDYRGSAPAESVEKESIALTPASKPSEVQLFSDVPEVEYQDYKTSQDMIDIIKDAEGFVATPYWDYLQWTIGYGTACGYEPDGSDVPSSYWDGISQYEAEQLLMDHVQTLAEDDVNYFFATKRDKQYPVSQNQFDAMVDFTYALGASWAYDDTSRVYQYLSNPTTEEDLVRSLGAWCRVSGQVFAPACSRRIRESLIFLDGSYFLPHGHDDVGHSDLEVVNDDDLPRFKYTIFDGNGIYMINTRTDDVNYYDESGTYDELPRVYRDEYTFSGWVDDNDKLLLESHPVDLNMEVRAEWVQLPFADVAVDDWFATAVAYCYQNNIMSGTGSVTFEPRADVSRAMLVTTLYRLAGQPEVTSTNPFPDVSDDSYYTDAVIWAAENDIVMGYNDGTFRPGSELTRAQMVTFLSRYVEGIKEADISSDYDLSGYRDCDNIPDYAENAFRWALSNGLIQGASGEVLNPRGNATRGQLAQVLMSLVNLK